MGPERAPLPWARVFAVFCGASGRLACENAGRPIPAKSPCRLSVPDLVTRLTAAEVVRPYSADEALVRTVNSCTAAKGRAVKMVCRPQLSSAVVLSMEYVVWRRPLPLAATNVS